MKEAKTTVSVSQLVAIGFIFVGVSVAWLILGGTLDERHTRASVKSKQSVTGHWGPSHTQVHPEVSYATPTPNREIKYLAPASGRVEVSLDYEPVKKGLTSSRTFDAEFDASYQITNTTGSSQTFQISFPLPSEQTSYKAFEWELNGEKDQNLMPEYGKIQKAASFETEEGS